jgi:hypothetical protein
MEFLAILSVSVTLSLFEFECFYPRARSVAVSHPLF